VPDGTEVVELYRKPRMDAKLTAGEPRVFISRSALLHNVKVVRAAMAPGTRLCAIVKADAYGHGASLVVDTLSHFSDGATESPAVDALAVATVDEACALPPTDLPVMILRPVENAFLSSQRERLEIAIRRGWTLTCCATSVADDLARIALACGSRAHVQVMVDSGMARSGVAGEDFARLIQRIESHPSLRLTSVCTHFARSEQAGDAYNTEQLLRFRQITDPVAQRAKPIARHACNSGAIFFHREAHFDLGRPGISLYGIDPTCAPCMDRALRPVLKWTAPIVHIRDLPLGSSVGYGQTWHSDRNTRVALIPVGYADGYARAFSNRAKVLLHGKTAPVVGRVSMDFTTIDLHGLQDVRVGDEVTLLDNDPLSPVSVYRLAQWADTIPYEIFCRIGARIHRVAADADEVPATANEREL
jgi:alanine racemase